MSRVQRQRVWNIAISRHRLRCRSVAVLRRQLPRNLSIVKMRNEQCPLCFGGLEVREVAPCEECGGDPQEIDHFRQGKHTYQRFEVFAGLELTLCNFCMVDFGSYDPTFFGLPQGSHVGFERMRFVQDVPNPTLGKDKYCPGCRRRLAFLKFVAAARELHST